MEVIGSWDENDEIYYEGIDRKNRIVRGVHSSLIFDLVPPPKTKPKGPSFTHDEILMLSDALIRAIGDASRAASLVDSSEAFEAIERHIKKLQNLNIKVNALDESE